MSGKIGDLTAEELILQHGSMSIEQYRRGYKQEDTAKLKAIEEELLRRLSVAPRVQGLTLEKVQVSMWNTLGNVGFNLQHKHVKMVNEAAKQLFDYLKPATAPSVAQARCPKCDPRLPVSGLTVVWNDKCIAVTCGYKHQFVLKTVGTGFQDVDISVFAQFFFSPSAPQVKDEIGCDMHHANGRVKGCTGCDWLNGEPSAANREGASERG